MIRKLPAGLKDFVRRVRGKATRNLAPSFTALQRPEDVPPLRCGVIGFGAMGKTHADVLRRHPYFSLAAVTSKQKLKRGEAEELGAHWFDSAGQMFQSGAVDAVVIATPHWSHAELAVAALHAGLHVICEKPLTVTVTQADTVLAAAQQSKGRLAVVCQNRFEPAYQQVKALLSDGELGPVIRCEMVETFWRSEAYYRSSPWRATWRGEGGGVLINQAPHVLDRYLWFCGMPERVTGFCDTLLHPIEVEDMASAVFRHAGGVHGQIHVNTNETPSLSRSVITCDRGRIEINGGCIQVTRLGDSISARTSASADFFGDLEGERQNLGGTWLGSAPELLGRFYTNFALAVVGRTPLLVNGTEGASVVELINAILLSSATGRAISLPLNRAEYDSFMAERVSGTESLES